MDGAPAYPKDGARAELRPPMHQLLHLIFEIAAFAVGYTYFQRLRTG
jgi:hypothetical protein